MKARINLCSLFLCLYIGIYAQKKAYKYPESKIIPQADTFFNTPVSDPYRWLENTNSPETKEWIQQQCRFSEKHLAKLSGRIGIKEELIRASDFSYQLPYKWGKYFLSDYYNSRINSSVLLVKNKYHKDFSYLCDFAGKYANEKTILKDCRINAGQNIVACITSKNGSDWCEIELVKLRSGNKMKDRLKNIMHSSIAWKGDGFYYSRYRAPDKRSERIVLSENQQVYFHKIGSAQEEDSLVFQRSESPLSVFTTETTYDERFLIIDEWCSEERRSTTYYRDFAAGENNIKPLNSHYDYYFSVIDNIKDELLVLTNHKAYNKRAVLINPRQPNVWKTFIPEDPKAMLMGIVMLKDKIVAKYQLKNKQFLIFYDYSGNVLHKTDFMDDVNCTHLSGWRGDNTLVVAYESYFMPKVIVYIDAENYKINSRESTKVGFDYTEYEVKNILAPARDSVFIPVKLFKKKSTIISPGTPYLVHVYGGYGNNYENIFNPGVLYFLQAGGVFADVGVRGSSAWGEKWYEDGRENNKPNCIHDFIDAVNFLVKSNYAARNKLAITGSSHGGLVVAAAVMKQPDLCKVAIPIVGVYDMIRAERYTSGGYNIAEFGTVKDKKNFEVLYSYSPYHKVNDNKNYPAMLIMTSEFDNRVIPMHSYKLAAALQASKGENQVLLRVEGQAGHNGSIGYMDWLDEMTDFYSFIFNQFND